MGVELHWRITQQPQQGGGYYRDQWEVWQFEDAIRRRDPTRISQARARARTYTAARIADTWWAPDGLFFHFVWQALETGDLDGAADDIMFWLSVSSADDVENNNANRTNCRNAVDMVTRFLAAPDGSDHPRASEIRRSCRNLAEECFSVLNRDQQDAVLLMARS